MGNEPDPGNGSPAARGVLVLAGISHHTATLPEREPFQVGREDLVPALRELRAVRRVREAVLLCTCNRFEAYLVVDEGEEAFSVLREFFIRFRGRDPAPQRSLFYVRHGSTVARHLFRVAAGLDSLVLGEYQIQAQVKEAYSIACSAKAPGKVLHRLFHAAFRAGKAVRTRTAVGAGRSSVAGVAVEVLKDHLSPEDRVLLVGVNENIRIVAEGLRKAGIERMLFANRTAEKAKKLARRFGGEGFGLEALPGLVQRAGGLVSCTGAPGAVVTASAFSDAPSIKICVDMAVPRDIAPPEGAPFAVLDLEDLKAHRDRAQQIRKEDLPAAESIVEDMVATFQAWMEHAFHPAAGAIVKEYDRIRRIRLEEAFAAFHPDDREALERFSRDLMQDFLKVPLRSLIEENGGAR